MRRLRRCIEVLFLTGLTLLFIGVGADWWGWMAKVQFLPSVLRLATEAGALNVGILCGLLALTLAFGRIYCSAICPLGALQDCAIALRRLADRRLPAALRKRFSYSGEHKALRAFFLAATAADLLSEVQFVAAALAPYSAYGRIVRSVTGLGDKGIGAATLVTGLLTLAGITSCAVLWGRIWCNTVCPVGTFLGLVSRGSLFRMEIDSSKCIGCRRCGRQCKAACIDTENHAIDRSRCLVCFDCVKACNEGAIKFVPRKWKPKK